jgi:hypothetical protein
MKFAFKCAIAMAAVSIASSAHANERLTGIDFEIEPEYGYVIARLGPVYRGRHINGPAIHLVRANAEGTALYGEVPEGEDDHAIVGGRHSLASNSRISVHATRLTPGNWIIYGTDSTCFCLGSYMFEVRAGEVTDMGTILADHANGRSDAEELEDQSVAEDLLDWRGREGIVVHDAMLVAPFEEDDPMLPEMAEMPIRPAEYVVDVRFDNIRGSLINRAMGLGPMHSVPLGTTGLIIGGEPAG